VLRDPKLRDPLSDVVSVIIALNAGARCLRSLLNYRLRSANNVPLSTLPLSSSPSQPRTTPFCADPPHPLSATRSSQLRPTSLFLSFLSPSPVSPVLLLSTWCTTAYLLLASPLNRISVLSDGPRAELRPYIFSSSLRGCDLLSLSRLFSYSGSLRNTSQETERVDASLSLSFAR